MLKRILRSRRGEGYIDVCVLVLCAMLVIALAVQVLPAFIAKQQLDTFATELVREAEIAGRIGPETDRREQALREQTGLVGSEMCIRDRYRPHPAQRGGHGHAHS